MQSFFDTPLTLLGEDTAPAFSLAPIADDYRCTTCGRLAGRSALCYECEEEINAALDPPGVQR